MNSLKLFAVLCVCTSLQTKSMEISSPKEQLFALCDVINIITTHLEDQDVLNLSISSKALREHFSEKINLKIKKSIEIANFFENKKNTLLTEEECSALHIYFRETRLNKKAITILKNIYFEYGSGYIQTYGCHFVHAPVDECHNKNCNFWVHTLEGLFIDTFTTLRQAEPEALQYNRDSLLLL